MKLNDFLACLEAIAPVALALDFDNPGLLIGPEKRDIRHVLVALDCTPVTAQEAVDKGVDMLLTHHPLFFHGVKHILPDDPETAAAWILLRHGIGLYAAHTNLDAAQGGVNDCLAAALGLIEVAPLPPENLGRFGTLPEPMHLRQFAAMVGTQLNAAVRYCGTDSASVSRVALVGGNGSGQIDFVKAVGADVYVTGEFRHHEALTAQYLGVFVVEAGHYETERVVLLPWIERLQDMTDDVQYSLSLLESACLRGF